MDKIIIGVYRDFDPVGVIDNERLDAAIEESDKQNIRLVFFDNENINFKDELITGVYRYRGKWENIRTKIPEIIINPIPKGEADRTAIENMLRGVSTFTSYQVISKMGLYNKLKDSKKYSKYAIESKEVESYIDILDSIERNKKVVLKPINGRQGDNIYLIYTLKDKIVVLDNGKKVKFDLEQFIMYIDGLLNTQEYLVQPYIEALTKNNEPFDFRVHLHRDGNGEWAIVKSYPRIGSIDGILSNISKGGKTLNIDDFLKKEYDSSWKLVKDKIESLAIELANYINSFYLYKINEIGVDIAIDKNGRYYTYELNGGPESKYHNKERAKYVIAYAKYLHQKKIQEYLQESLKYISTELLKIEAKSLNNNYERQVYIGILSYPNEEELFNKAAGYVGLENEVNVFHFYPEDINYKNKSIDGRWYNRYKLERKVIPYPDVIIDRLRMRGIGEFDRIYKEFKSVIFNIDTRGGSACKSNSYNLIKDKELTKYLIPYLLNPNIDNVVKFLEKYKDVVIKPDIGTKGYGVLRIKKKNNETYTIMKDESYKECSYTNMLTELRAILDDDFIIQKYIESNYKDQRPFDTRCHLVKNGLGEWEVLKIYAKVGAKNKLTSNSLGGGYTGDIDPILDYKFGSKKEKIYKYIEKTGYILANEIEKNIKGNISEIGFDLAITNEGELYIYEINLNKPESEFFSYELAKKLVHYSIYLYNNKIKLSN